MSAGPGVGDKAPPFTLARGDGGTVSLADFKGRNLVLYFYPKADTSGCTREAIDFTRLKAAFARAGTDVLGVSADPPAKLAAFSAKHGLTVPLGSDQTRKIIEAYGCWVKKSMYGRSYMGVARTTFLIGPNGRIAEVWPKVKIDGHADEVLAAAKALEGVAANSGRRPAAMIMRSHHGAPVRVGRLGAPNRGPSNSHKVCKKLTTVD